MPVRRPARWQCPQASRPPRGDQEVGQPVRWNPGGDVAVLRRVRAILVIEALDNASAAACSLAVSSSGAFKAFRTTPLLSVEEGMAAMKKAAKLNYKPPTGKK